MKLFSKCLLVLLLAAGPASAMDRPYTSNAATANASGTITSAGTFQSVFVAQDRAACMIQNNGTHTMWVFFGPIASATHGNSIALAAAASITCGANGVVRRDQVSIDGTTADVFYADQQI